MFAACPCRTGAAHQYSSAAARNWISRENVKTSDTSAQSSGAALESAAVSNNSAYIYQNTNRLKLISLQQIAAGTFFFFFDIAGKTQVHSLHRNYPAVSVLVGCSLRVFSARRRDSRGSRGSEERAPEERIHISELPHHH